MCGSTSSTTQQQLAKHELAAGCDVVLIGERVPGEEKLTSRAPGRIEASILGRRTGRLTPLEVFYLDSIVLQIETLHFDILILPAVGTVTGLTFQCSVRPCSARIWWLQRLDVIRGLISMTVFFLKFLSQPSATLKRQTKAATASKRSRANRAVKRGLACVRGSGLNTVRFSKILIGNANTQCLHTDVFSEKCRCPLTLLSDDGGTVDGSWGTNRRRERASDFVCKKVRVHSSEPA